MLSTFRKWKSKKEKKRKLLIQVIENHHGGEMFANLEDTLNGILGKRELIALSVPLLWTENY